MDHYRGGVGQVLTVSRHVTLRVTGEALRWTAEVGQVGLHAEGILVEEQVPVQDYAGTGMIVLELCFAIRIILYQVLTGKVHHSTVLIGHLFVVIQKVIEWILEPFSFKIA